MLGELSGQVRAAVGDGATLAAVGSIATAPPGLDNLSGMTLDAIERLVIEHTITRHEGSLPAAARSLGISPSTLYRKRERWSGANALN